MQLLISPNRLTFIYQNREIPLEKLKRVLSALIEENCSSGKLSKSKSEEAQVSKENEYLILISEQVEAQNFLKRQNEDLKVQNITLVNENEEMRSKIVQSLDEIEAYKDEFPRVTNSLSKLEKSNTELKNAYSEKDKELLSMCRKHSKLEKDFKEEIHRMTERAVSIDERMMEQQNIIENQKKQIHTLNTTVKELTFTNENLYNLNEEASKKDSQLKMANEKSANYERLIMNLKDKISSMSETIQELKLSQNIIDFTGTINNGKKEGKGVLKTDTFEYEGLFKDDRFNGKGKLRFFANNKTLDGEFDEIGYFVGNKLMIGEVEYHGSIVGNEMNGKGALNFKNNFIVEGSFLADSLIDGNPCNIINLDDGSEEPAIAQSDEVHLLTAENVKYKLDFASGQLQRLDN
jgi:hypothetical protein